MNNAMTTSNRSPYFRSEDSDAVVTWKVIGFRESVYQVAPGEPYRPAGCCDKCGQGIRYVVTVKSSDGRVMDVGQDCAVTLKGGPELAEIRRAEAAYRHEQYLQSDAYKADQEKARARQAAEAAAKARAEEEFALELFGLRAILRSGNTTQWEKDHATARQNRILSGHGDWEMDEQERWTIAIAATKAFLPAATGYTGTVGEKIERRALFEAMIPMHSQFGSSWMHKFRTASGELLVWKTGACDLRARDLGEWVTIRGTVKSHNDYRGEAQTTLTRCKTAK